MLKLNRDYIEAKLHTAKGKLTGDWYVHYSIRNPETGKMVLFKKRKGINYIKSKRERIIAGNKIVQVINQMLMEGSLNPFKKKQAEKVYPLIESLQKESDLKKALSQAGTLRLKTPQTYSTSIKVFTNYLHENKLDGLQAKEFTRQRALEYCDYLLRVKKYKGITFNNQKGHLSAYFNSFINKEIIASNPFHKIKSQPVGLGKNIAFTESQEKELSEYLIKNNFRLYLFTQFMKYCYIRRIELVRLYVSNVNLSQQKIIIYSSQSKNKKQESVDIPDIFCELISQMELQKHASGDFLMGHDLQTCNVPMHPNWPTSLHSRILRTLGFPEDVTMYSWKHTGVVSAYREGVDVYSIMRQLRHSSLDYTMIYLKSLGLERNTEFMTKMK